MGLGSANTFFFAQNIHIKSYTSKLKGNVLSSAVHHPLIYSFPISLPIKLEKSSIWSRSNSSFYLRCSQHAPFLWLRRSIKQRGAVNVPKIQPGIFGIFGNFVQFKFWRRSQCLAAQQKIKSKSGGRLLLSLLCHTFLRRGSSFLLRCWVSPTDRTAARAGGCILITLPHGNCGSLCDMEQRRGGSFYDG